MAPTRAAQRAAGVATIGALRAPTGRLRAAPTGWDDGRRHGRPLRHTHSCRVAPSRALFYSARTSRSGDPSHDALCRKRVAVVTGAGRASGARRRCGWPRRARRPPSRRRSVGRGPPPPTSHRGRDGATGGVDVSDPGQVSEAVDGASRLGRPEVLVNCAGIGRFDHTVQVAFDTWARTIAVNLGGTFLMCQAVLPHLLDGGGSIVNIASNSGLQGVPLRAAYSASKGGVVDADQAPGARVPAARRADQRVAPGGMATPLQKSFHQLPDGCRVRRPARQACARRSAPPPPAEVAALVAFRRLGRRALHDRIDRLDRRGADHLRTA